MPRADDSRWWLAAEGAVALALVAVPWSLGGAPAWAAWVVLGLAAAALLLWAVGAAQHHRRWGAHPVLAVPLTFAAVALLQLVPLPPALLAVLSPPAAELRDFALVPLGLEAWRPVSLDPPSTARALARSLALAAFLFVALQLGRQEAVRRRLLGVLALCGVSVAVTGFGHLLAGERALFGLHHFTASLPLLTPFGNTNHLAAFLTLAGTVAVGLGLEARSKDVAIAWAAAAFACGVGVFLSFSRGGIGSFMATWGLVAAAVLARRGGGLRAVLPWVLIGATVSFAGLLAFEQLVARAETVSSVERLAATKVDLWPMLWAGVAHAWPLGLGAGAFEVGFVRWQTTQLDVTFTHPEFLPVQVVSDAGVPVAVGLLLLGAWLAWRAWREVGARPLERTALVGVLGVLLHDVFDFALELPATAVAAAVVAGLVAAARPDGARWRLFGWGVPAAGGAMAVAAVALLAGSPGHREAERALTEALAAQPPAPALRGQVVRVVDRHPADWVPYALAAQAFAQRSDPREALAWVNRLLLLRPGDAGAHVSAARALVRLNQPLQALGELKLAWALGEVGSLELGLSVALRAQALERLLLDQPGHLTALYERLRRRKLAAEALALVDAVELSPVGDAVRAEAAGLRVRHAAELGEPAAALAAWEALPEAVRAGEAQQLVKVGLLQKLGRGDEAVAVLEALVARQPGKVELAFHLADVLGRQGRPAAAREVLARAGPFIGAPKQRSQLYQREAALLLQEGRFGRAVEALQTAARLEPARADLQYRLAEAFERLGSPRSALEAVRKGRLLDTPAGAKARDAQVQRLEALLAAPP